MIKGLSFFIVLVFIIMKWFSWIVDFNVVNLCMI